jgi:hypothetical protein
MVDPNMVRYSGNLACEGKSFRYQNRPLSLVFQVLNKPYLPDRTKRQDLFNSMGSMYSSVLTLGVENAGVIQPVVAADRMVFYKERASGMYLVPPHTLAQVITVQSHSNSAFCLNF